MAICLGWKVQAEEIKVELWAKMGIEEAGKARGMTRVEEEMKEKLIAIVEGSTFWVAWLKNEGWRGWGCWQHEKSQSWTWRWEKMAYGFIQVGEMRVFWIWKPNQAARFRSYITERKSGGFWDGFESKSRSQVVKSGIWRLGDVHLVMWQLGQGRIYKYRE